MIRVISSFADGPVKFNPNWPWGRPDPKVNFEHWNIFGISRSSMALVSGPLSAPFFALLELFLFFPSQTKLKQQC